MTNKMMTIDGFPRRAASASGRRAGGAGFTLIELLVVIAIIAILAAMLLPALNYAKQQSYGTHDLNSTKQIQYAWSMYANESKDSLPGNDWGVEKDDGGFGADGGTGYPPTPTTPLAPNWVSGWEQLGIPADPDNTNTFILTDPRYAQIGPYLINPKVYQCAASKSLCAGYDLPLARDFSMSVWMGSISNTPNQTDTNEGFMLFTKQSAITGRMPGATYVFNPSMAMVFIEEKDDSVDDGEFLVQMTVLANMANIPASYHAGAGLASFADGHAEVHKWVSSVVLVPGQQAGMVVWPGGVRPDNFKTITDGNYADLGWLQKHSTFSPQEGAYQQTAIEFSTPN
jgi:prepilin-type N-terminal cleavage/methylation domain-containing protein